MKGESGKRNPVARADRLVNRAKRIESKKAYKRKAKHKGRDEDRGPSCLLCIG